MLRDVTGGSNGINGFANEFQDWNPLNPSQEYGGRVFGEVNLEFTGADLWEMIIGWSLVGSAVLVMWLLVSSPWGRVLKSIREDEDAARALGKNVFRFKMQSLILGGTFGTDRRHVLRHLEQLGAARQLLDAGDVLRPDRGDHRRARAGRAGRSSAR